MDIDSCYFTGEEYVEPVVETTLQKLKHLFPDKLSHMQTIIKCYKFCFTNADVEKPVFEKTTDEIIDEIHNTPIKLDFGKSIQEHAESLNKYHQANAILGKKLEQIPRFIDFAYIYYVWCYDESAPIFKLPNSVVKFNLILDAIQVDVADEINQNFMYCITDEFIKDIRITQPPFMMRTELSPTEIREKINAFASVAKKIINKLFALDKATRGAAVEHEAAEAKEVKDETKELETMD